MIVPEDEPRTVKLLHGESMLSVDVLLDEEESLEDCAAFFRQVLPKAEVAAPMVLSEPSQDKLKKSGGSDVSGI